MSSVVRHLRSRFAPCGPIYDYPSSRVRLDARRWAGRYVSLQKFFYVVQSPLGSSGGLSASRSGCSVFSFGCTVVSEVSFWRQLGSLHLGRSGSSSIVDWHRGALPLVFWSVFSHRSGNYSRMRLPYGLTCPKGWTEVVTQPHGRGGDSARTWSGPSPPQERSSCDACRCENAH